MQNLTYLTSYSIIQSQCRDRWINHLDPSLKKGGWTAEEDAILNEAQRVMGNSWKKVSEMFYVFVLNNIVLCYNAFSRRLDKTNLTRRGRSID